MLLLLGRGRFRGCNGGVGDVLVDHGLQLLVLGAVFSKGGFGIAQVCEQLKDVRWFAYTVTGARTAATRSRSSVLDMTERAIGR